MLNTLRIYHDLRETMDAVAAEKIADYLGQMYTELQDMVTKEDFRELKAAVKNLADAQNRTEQRVEELTAAQKELVVAQQRTEQRVEELAAAQQRTENELKTLTSSVKNLERSHEKLTQQVGGLSDNLGGDIEDVAYSLVYRILSDEFGWKIGEIGRVWQTWGKEPEEVNIFAQATDPKDPASTIWIVGEAKHNLTIKELEKFLKQYVRARKHLTGAIFPVCFCYRARPEVQERAQKAGIHLLFSYGKLT